MTYTQKTMVALSLLISPLASMAVTTAGYERWGDTAGVVLWRADGSTFHNSRVIDVAADGTLGNAYYMDANFGATSWQRFASTQTGYSSPGKVLVYDENNYTASSDSQFYPISFGGMWVKSLAANDVPYSIIGTGTRTTEFGATGKSTYFRFDKSFTIDRQGTTYFNGTATVDIAADATFTAQAKSGQIVSVPSGSELVLTNGGTFAVTTLNVAGTLNLSAEPLPTISGNVTLADGATIALPAGVAFDETISFEVCSGTLTAAGAVNVKIGDDPAVLSSLTVANGAITKIEAVSSERTYTSDWPLLVPAGCTWTYVGGSSANDAAALDGLVVNGTLKTEGYFNFTNYKSSNGSTFEVLGGSVVEVSSGDRWIHGTVIIRENATFKNGTTDAIDWWDTTPTTIYVYGELAMGSTRWSFSESNILHIYDGGLITGTGQGANGTLDFIEKQSGRSEERRFYAHGTTTISAPIRNRDTSVLRFDVDDGKTLTISGGTIGPGVISKSLAGTLKFTCSPTWPEITVGNGTLVFDTAEDVTNTVKYTTTFPSAPAFATQSNWKGTVALAGMTIAGTNFNNYGNAASTIKLSGVSGYLGVDAECTVPIILENGNYDFALKLNDGFSPQSADYSSGAYVNLCAVFHKISGSGSIVDGIADNGKGSWPIIKVYDASGFTGNVSLDRAILLVCDSTTQYSPSLYEMFKKNANKFNTNGVVRIESSNPMSLPASKTWNVNAVTFNGPVNFTTSEPLSEGMVLFTNGNGPVAKKGGASFTTNGEPIERSSYKVKAAGNQLQTAKMHGKRVVFR